MADISKVRVGAQNHDIRDPKAIPRVDFDYLMNKAQRVIDDAEHAVDDAVDRIEEIGNKLIHTFPPDSVQTISNHTARITNLEAAANGYLYREDEHEGVSYSVTVPENALPYALIDSIEPRSLVWSQIATMQKSYPPNTDYFSRTVIDDRHHRYSAKKAAGQTTGRDVTTSIQGVQNGRYYYISVFVNPSVTCDVTYGTNNIFRCVFGEWTRLTLVRMASAPSGNWYLPIHAQFNFSESFTMDIRDGVIIDLTQAFGVQAAAMTAETCRAMFPADYYYPETSSQKNFSPETVVARDADGSVVHEYDVRKAVFPLPVEVVAGGSLTFTNIKGDDYRIPLPHAETFLLKLPGGGA